MNRSVIDTIVQADKPKHPLLFRHHGMGLCYNNNKNSKMWKDKVVYARTLLLQKQHSADNKTLFNVHFCV